MKKADKDYKFLIKFFAIFLAIVIAIVSVVLIVTYPKRKLISEYTKSLEYYNTKAIANVSSLIGRKPSEIEDWIFETYSKSEIKKETDKDGNVCFSSSDGNVYMLTYSINGENIFLINTTMSDELALSGYRFKSSLYLSKVKDFCNDNNADYRKAPMVAQITITNFDKADRSAIQFGYLFGDDGKGFKHKKLDGYYAYASFQYNNGKFVKTPEDSKYESRAIKGE